MAPPAPLRTPGAVIDNLMAPASPLRLPSSSEPLTEFTLFSQLATEIRLKIWKYALPIPNDRLRRMIQVRGWVSTTLKSRDYSRLTLEYNDHSSIIMDIGMSGANFESRQVYIAAFPNTLQTKNFLTKKKGVIRYSDEDIIYVSNMDKLMEDHYNRAAIYHHDQLDHLLKTVRYLALPIHCFVKNSYMSPTPEYRYGNLILDFQRLQGLGAVLDYAWWNYSKNEEEKMAKQKSLRHGWWKELTAIQKELQWNWHHQGVDRGVPAFGLMGTDGLLLKGWSAYMRRYAVKEVMAP